MSDQKLEFNIMNMDDVGRFFSYLCLLDVAYLSLGPLSYPSQDTRQQDTRRQSAFETELRVS